MLKDSFIKLILKGYYNTHPQGDVLVELDLEAVLLEAQTEKENSENSSKLDLKDHE